ncbi:MAG: hypothetical protein H6Q31_296 [Bacteroidetes bacterium]|jgi:hypothetical protein|nr:hypothetical protein [Bacteroidota bacterium]
MDKDIVTELLNKELDGILTAADRQTLDDLLAADENVRTLRRDLQGITHLCAESQPVDPPATLRPAVRREIETIQNAPARTAHPASGARGILEFFSRLFAPRPQARLAYAFLGGIVFGGLILALVMNLIQRGTVREDEVLGSMVTADPAESAWTTIPVSTPLVHGKISTQRSGTTEGVQIDLAYQGSGLLRLRLDIGTRTVEMLRQAPPQPEDAVQSHGALPRVEIQDGQILVHGNQIRDLRLVFRHAAPDARPISIELFEGEAPLYKSHLFEQ